MKTRAITGFFFIVVMLASVLLGHYVFDIFYLVLAIFCLYEFYSLIKQSGISPNKTTGILNGILLYVTTAAISWSDNDPGFYYSLLILVFSVTAIFVQELFKKSKAPITNIAYTIFGSIFIVVPFCFFSCHGLC